VDFGPSLMDLQCNQCCWWIFGSSLVVLVVVGGFGVSVGLGPLLDGLRVPLLFKLVMVVTWRRS
jgi:hypothetical protein